MKDRRRRSPENSEEEERETSPEAKRQQREDESDDVGEDIMAWLSMEEYEEEEENRLIVELLEAEKGCAAEANKVRFTENPYYRSTSPASVFQTTPSSYVTINGNEESCGSSFSDWDSSVMASVDMASFSAAGSELFASGFTADMDGAWGGRAEEGFGGEWDGLDLDDDSLTGFLGEIFPEQSLA
ncbi:hypothetical protein L484_027275 [Morus notabilis]|uniref:Uncharacterized protein n=1 Tax=Morus notabilis TaxID=981085 RepID=W9QJX5_9ROSA|nr:uncharacterized protein LOC21409898 isoform X1 [Morus notabilis]XP_024017238.1 uncharacterized protein LOC21409898 isoform X2 [Morus notabilis]EXB38841.1 hypothetical protein L484_027275 [Morus notabilis]